MGGRIRRTQTFTSSGTFVVPVGVSNLISVVGKGQDGSPVTWLSDDRVLVNVYRSVYSFALSPWAWIGASVQAQSLLDAINVGAPNERIITIQPKRFDTSVYNTSYQGPYDEYGGPFSETIRGTWTKVGTWPTVSAPNGFDSMVVYGFRVSGEFKNPTANGLPSIGFGKTFSGGVGVPATPVTYNDVSVTPGGSYPVTVPSGGYITIVY